MNNSSSEILCFIIDGQKFALPLNAIDIVIRSQAITHLENTLSFLCGVIDLHGEIIPIISLRKKFHMTEADIKITDRFIIVNTEKRKVGIIAEQVEDIIQVQEDQVKESTDLFRGLRHIRVLNREDGMVLIYDIESIIDKDEEIGLQQVLSSYLNEKN